MIDDVRCIVVRDEVFEDGSLIESTNDWYAQAKDGDVWYCGEETRSFETSSGDRPMKPELVSIDGSFKAGRDGGPGDERSSLSPRQILDSVGSASDPLSGAGCAGFPRARF